MGVVLIDCLQAFRFRFDVRKTKSQGYYYSTFMSGCVRPEWLESCICTCSCICCSSFSVQLSSVQVGIYALGTARMLPTLFFPIRFRGAVFRSAAFSRPFGENRPALLSFLSPPDVRQGDVLGCLLAASDPSSSTLQIFLDQS